MIAHSFLIFNFGGGEIFLILMVFILLFGAKRIPEVARALGKGMREIRNATSDIQREIKDATGDSASLSRQMEERIKQQARDIEGAIARNTPKPKADEPPAEDGSPQMKTQSDEEEDTAQEQDRSSADSADQDAPKKEDPTERSKGNQGKD